MDAIAVVVSAALGVLIGPWLVAVVERVPDRQPVPATLWPTPLESSAEPNRARQLGVRLGAPALLVLAAVRWGASPVLIPFLVLYAGLLVLSVIDIEHHRLPNRVLFPTLWVSLALIVGISVVEGFPSAIIGALAGAGFYFTLLLIPHLIYPPGMGFGDVKLALLLGLFLGWIHQTPLRAVALVLWALIIASALGTLMGLAMTIVRRRRGEFPFGPALAVGCIVVISFSDRFLGF
jgi:leader peptidase (prepilin peptidase)/N-methyltransferase